MLSRILDSFRAPAPLPPAANELPVVESWLVGRPQAQEQFDLRKLIDEGYRRNVVVYSCVNEVAQSVPSARLYLRDRVTQEEVKEHPILDLIARPNPESGWYELCERALIHLQTAGVGYIHKLRNGSGEPVGMETIRPDRLFPLPSALGRVEEYEYRLSGQAAGKGQRVPASDVIALRLYDPTNDYLGLSPLMVCAVWGDIDWDAAIYLRDFFTNGAMPLGLLKLKSPRVTQADRMRVQAEWRETYGRGDGTGKSRWHDLAVIGAEAEFERVGSEPAQLRMDSLWGMSESRICAAYGIPPIVVGVKVGLQHATYSNYKEARGSLWSETLVPITRRVAEAFTRGLCSEWDDRLELAFDYDSVAELQEDLDKRSDRAIKLWSSGLARRNEARVMADLEEEGEDFVFEPSAGKMLAVEGGVIVRPEPPPPPSPLMLPPAAPPRQLPSGQPQPDDGPKPPEPQGTSAREVLGIGASPAEAEELIAEETEAMGEAFDAAVRAAVRASDTEALKTALAAGSRARAEQAVATKEFGDRYGRELQDHLARVATAAQRVHLQHHLGGDREEHALRDLPAKIRDAITSRVTREARRFSKEARQVVRREIMAVLRGAQEAVSPQSIVASIGLSARQGELLARARQRLVGDGAKGNRLLRELDKFRVKLLRERSEAIAAHETRVAAALGQRAAWERMIADGTLRGGRRHWHKMWVKTSAAEEPICEELDRQEVRLDQNFEADGEEYEAPPDPHPGCQCTIVLVEVS